MWKSTGGSVVALRDCWFGPAELGAGSEVGSSAFREGMLVASTCEGEKL